MTTKCPECQSLLPDNAVACPNCGYPFEVQHECDTHCPECGNPVAVGVSACPNCGYPIEWEDAPIICPECGAEVEYGMTVCPNCAYPMVWEDVPLTHPNNGTKNETDIASDTNSANEQHNTLLVAQTERTTEKSTSQTKAKVSRGLIIVFAILAVASFVFGFFYAKATNDMISDSMEAIANRNPNEAGRLINKAGDRITTSKQKKTINLAYNKCQTLERVLEEERQERIRQEELRKQREREEAERRRKEEMKQEIISKLQGTWEWSGRIHVWGSQYEYVSCKIVVDGKYMTFYGNSGINDQGSITDIDLDERRISFGSYSTVEYGYVNGEYRLYYSKDEGQLFERTSYSSNSYSHSNSSSSYSSTTFRTSSDVMAYVSNRFKNSIGNVITIKYDGLYCNGNQITNAVRVARFDGSYAKLTATSPYTQGTLYFTVDASRGTITDGSGDVFYKR